MERSEAPTSLTPADLGINRSSDLSSPQSLSLPTGASHVRAEISQFHLVSQFLTHRIMRIRIALCHFGVICFTAITNVVPMHCNHILCKKLQTFAAETSCSPAKAPWIHPSGPLSQSLAIQGQQCDTGRSKLSRPQTRVFS